MKKTLLLILCAAMIVTMAACGDAQTETPETTVAPTEATAAPIEAPTEVPTEPEPTAEELYAQAIEKLSEMDSMTLEIRANTKTVLGNQTFTEKSSQTLVLQNMGETSFAASLQDTTYLGTYCTKSGEIYVDGTLYFNITPDGNMRATRVNYKTEMSAEDYLDRMIPAQLLDAGLYETIEKTGENQLLFSAANGLEEWAEIDGAVIKEGSGTATLSESGALSGSTYRVIYQLGTAEVTYEVSVEIIADEAAAIEAPDNADNYRLLEGTAYLGPYLLQRAMGCIYQMDTTTIVEAESAFSAATGWSHVYQETANTYIGSDTKLAKFDYVYQLTDLYTGETYYDDVISELFENGKYTYTYNNGKPDEYELQYSVISDALWEANVKAIPQQSFIASYEVGNYGGMILLEYQLSETADKKLTTGVAGLMFAEADTLDNLASAYRTENATGYIGFDAATGIPTAVGFDYTGVHTIEGVEYQLVYALGRTFMTGQDAVYETITGEALEDDGENEGATPLFYKVTGADGQQMWLLGTIHVGDERTEELPEEIWTAFDSADSLAVEFDMDAFTEQTENDPQFASQLLQLYVYSDGTTTKDHISDPEIYECALKRMKASGMMNSTVEAMKAYIWAQNFGNYSMEWNYELSSDEGMDQRLLDRAKEQEKKILEVESGLSQLTMLTGFSDELQEMLLASAVFTTPVEEITATNELYELWCAGDEAELIAYLYGEDEPQEGEEEMTEEEKLLYEEYEKAMETDRNAAMLEVAKGYLESGEVVFYAVGLAHLIAEDGLVNTLRDAGYTVELVPYS